MNRNHSWQKKINKELEDIQFNSKEKVHQMIQKKESPSRWSRFWHYEFELPVLPLFSIVLFIFLIVGIQFIPTNQMVEQDKIVEIDGNMYWESDLEGWLVFDED